MEDGVNGTLAPRRDPFALARAIDRYLADPDLLAARGRASREWAVARFGLDRMCAANAELYESLSGAAATR